MMKLETVSFKGVDLTNMEFHNVKWITKKENFLLTLIIIAISNALKKTMFPQLRSLKFKGIQNFRIIKTLTSTSRSITIDECLLDRNCNYDEVSKIYHQLRKNFEGKLQYNDASHFFLGEMETRRKSTIKSSGFVSGLQFSIYKHLSFYGENIVLPLCIFTPIVIIFFTLCYHAYYPCQVKNEDCTFVADIGRSLSSYFQFNTSPNIINVLERLLAIPILDTIFIGLKRRLERQK